MPRIPEPPRNETDQHFFLKQISTFILTEQFGCQYAATEVHGLFSSHTKEEKTARGVDFKHMTRNVTDACGVRSRKKGDTETWDVISIEAKVSRSDLAAGYCVGADFNYVIVPKGLIMAEALPPDIGLIEVDLVNAEFTWRFGLKGAKVTRRAKRVKRSRYGYADSHDRWAKQIIATIGRLLTAQARSKNPWFSDGYNGYRAEA